MKNTSAPKTELCGDVATDIIQEYAIAMILPTKLDTRLFRLDNALFYTALWESTWDATQEIE